MAPALLLRLYGRLARVHMKRDEELEQFLTDAGFCWELIERTRHYTLANQWQVLYGDALSPESRIRHKQGAKAQHELSRQSAPAFLIVPFLGETAGQYSLSSGGPRTVAYECHGPGPIPDLSAFAAIDFFMSSPDFAWTMIHTHEDETYGGPFFIRREWLVRAIRSAH